MPCRLAYKVTDNFLFKFNCPNNFHLSLLPSRSTMAASFLLSHFSIIAFDKSFADETSDLLYKTTLVYKLSFIIFCVHKFLLHNFTTEYQTIDMRLIDYFRQINLTDWGLGLGLLMDIMITQCIKTSDERFLRGRLSIN